MADLRGVRAKITQANHHLRNLKVSIKRRIASKKHGDSFRVHDDVERKMLVGRAHVTEPALKWRLLVGDVAHNLRSSLDHLVFQLALLKDAEFKHERRTAFPIFDDIDEFKSKGIRRVKPYVSREAYELIVEHQPYKRPNPQRDLLWILSELDNIDKHRTVVELGKHFNLPDIVLKSRLTKREARFRSQRRDEFRTLKHGDEMFMVSYANSTDGPPEVDLDGLSMLVTFQGTKICDNRGVLPLMRDVVSKVVSVVDEFDSEFFRPKAKA